MTDDINEMKEDLERTWIENAHLREHCHKLHEENVRLKEEIQRLKDQWNKPIIDLPTGNTTITRG